MPVPPSPPVVIYDGECAFCRRWIARAQRLTAHRVRYQPYQGLQTLPAHLTLDHVQAAMHLIEADGRVSRGAEAVVRTVAHAPGGAWWLWVYLRVPGAAAIMERVYAHIAQHRSGCSAGSSQPPSRMP